MNNVAVVGQGYVGMPIALAVAKSGMNVVALDSNKKLVSELRAGRCKLEGINLNTLKKLLKRKLYFPTSDIKSLRTANIILVCLPTPLDKNGKPDTSILENFFKNSVNFISNEALVIIESTVAPGYTRDLYKKLKSTSKSGKKIDFDIAFSPERIDPLNKNWNLKNTPKLVAGLTNDSRQRAVNFYSKFVKNVVPCSSIEIAETAKLLENSFRLINISFINEISEFCTYMDIDVQEVISAAATKPYGFMTFYPSLGVGGHCIPVDPVYLLEKAKSQGVNLKLIEEAKKINDINPLKIIKRLNKELGSLKSKKILIIGIAYKPNISDTRESPAINLIKLLRKKGAKVSWHDELVMNWNGEKSVPLSDKFDVAVLATLHDSVDLKTFSTVKIIDSRGSI